MTFFFQILSLPSRVICAASQSGSQSAAQPCSEFSVPAIATVPGWVAGGSPSSGTVWVGGLTTCVVDESAATRPAASLTIARYSSGVASGMPDTSWKTRNGALSSVPRFVQVVSPTLRHRNVVWAKVLACTSALTSVRPYAPPSASTVSTVGAAPEVEIGLLAFHTLTVSGGTVTFTEPSAAGLTAVSVP